MSLNLAAEESFFFFFYFRCSYLPEARLWHIVKGGPISRRILIVSETDEIQVSRLGF